VLAFGDVSISVGVERHLDVLNKHSKPSLLKGAYFSSSGEPRGSPVVPKVLLGLSCEKRNSYSPPNS
jgi:hypothetical protein